MKLDKSDPDIVSLVGRIQRGDVDLQPDFQRQEVWSPAKKKRLIDTILRRWSIPPVHLIETADGRHEVLDGQQRLATIRDFLENKFSIDGHVSPEDDEIKSLHRKYFRQLDGSHRRRIESFSIRCFVITDYSPEEPSELFYRLNQPTMLTAGEQRNAFYGPARAQLKELVQAFLSLGNKKETIGFSNTRLAFDDVIARVLYFAELNTFSEKGTEKRISDRFKEQRAFSDSAYDASKRAIENLSEAREIAETARLNKASLLSWLLFFCRFAPDESPKLEFFSEFYSDESNLLTGFVSRSARAVFDDRSSLRVTDVSSVAFRDFSLWLLYQAAGNPLPRAVNGATIKEIVDIFEDREDITLDYLLSQSLDIASWSRLA